MNRKAKREAQLRAEGIEGKAKLIESWIIGKSGGELELIELIEYELEVMVTGKQPYKVKHRQLTPFGVFTRLSKGTIIPVKVHPEKPKQLLLDWEQTGTQVQVMDAADLPVNLLEVIQGLGETDGKRDLKYRLRELEDALKEELITVEEYESKRAELLKTL
jgi:hypothetical protein